MLFALRFLLSVVISLLTSLLLIPRLCGLAKKLNFYDEPDGKLKVQKSKVPYFGGVAIYCGFIFSLAMTFPFYNDMSLYLIGSTLLLLVGLVDDLVAMTPLQKFMGQTVASLCFIKAGFFLKEAFFYSPINIAFSLLWFLTIINALNLVDVMDGLSAVVSMCAASTFCIFFYLNGSWPAMILFGALFGAILGFFIYNKPPAKIYMGDAGTLFVGGLLASAPFFVTWCKYNSIGLLVPIVILMIPLLELAGLIMIRLYKSIPFYQGSPDHFSIYMQAKGWSKGSVLKFCFAFSVALAAIATSFFLGHLNIAHLVAILGLLIAIWLKALN